MLFKAGWCAQDGCGRDGAVRITRPERRLGRVPTCRRTNNARTSRPRAPLEETSCWNERGGRLRVGQMNRERCEVRTERDSRGCAGTQQGNAWHAELPNAGPTKGTATRRAPRQTTHLSTRSHQRAARRLGRGACLQVDALMTGLFSLAGVGGLPRRVTRRLTERTATKPAPRPGLQSGDGRLVGDDGVAPGFWFRAAVPRSDVIPAGEHYDTPQHGFVASNTGRHTVHWPAEGCAG